jgi:Ca2+-binding RTX toxin-like protein
LNLAGDDVNYTVTGLVADLTVADAHTGNVTVTTGSAATVSVGFGTNVTGTHSVNADALTDGQVLTLTGTDEAAVTLTLGDLSAAAYVGNLTVTATTGTNVITTGNGNDTITGGAGADVITSGLGDDSITGGADDDTINLDGGDNTVTDAGDGDDTINITVAGVNAIAVTGLGLVTLNADALGATVTVDAAVDGNVDAANSTVAVTLKGDAGDDTLIGGAGADTITGGAGADVLSGGSGANTYIYNSIVGNTSDSNSAVFDTITNLVISDFIYLNLGDVNNFEVATDVIFSSNTYTADTNGDSSYSHVSDISFLANGLAANDAEARAMTILNATGTVSNDTISGGRNADTILGGDGADIITGGEGADILTGGTGTDIFVFNAIVGLSSDSNILFDTISDLDLAADFIKLNLINVNNFKVFDDVMVGPGTYEANRSKGSVGDDVVIAVSVAGFNDNSARAITILNAVGTAGNDLISGGQNSDTISGGDGNDTISGGSGADEINLGIGKDTVVFTSFATLDTVTNFSAGAGADVIAFDLGDLNSEMGSGNRINNGNGFRVFDTDVIDFSAVISNGSAAGVTGITFSATDNIYLVDEATALDVQAAIQSSLLATSGSFYDGDGILVAYIDANSDLVIAMAVLTVTGVTIDTATLSTIGIMTGTYTLADLTTGNFDFLA